MTYTLEEGSDTLKLATKTDWHEIGGATIPVLAFQAPLSYQPSCFRYDTAAGSVCRESTANDVPGLQSLYKDMLTGRFGSRARA